MKAAQLAPESKLHVSLSLEPWQTNPLVSVVIPTRNYGRYIAEAVESVRKQTYKNMETIIVDDESTDNTASIVKELGVKYMYIKHVGPRSPANAMNVGIKHSKGDFIICLAADDVLDPDYVESCLRKFEAGVGFVWTGRQEFGDSQFVRMPNVKTLTRKCFFPDPGAALGAMMVKREAYQKTGLYDVSLDGFEDWDMTIRISAAGFVGKPVMKPLHRCRIHGQPKRNLGVLTAKYPRIKAYMLIDRMIHRVVNPLKALQNLKLRLQQSDRHMPQKNASKTTDEDLCKGPRLGFEPRR